MARDPEHDLVIRNGLLADGTGAPLREADVAVTGGGVAEVGTVTGRGRREIDAAGALVAPGWVDIHTHYDGQATWDRHLFPSSAQGVTTVVFGNCGVGFAPVRRSDRERLIALMEGVEDIPGTALHEGLPWDWTSFPDFLDVDEEWVVLRHMAETSGRPLTISVAQIPERPTDHRAILDRIAAANADGLEVTAQVAPRSIGLLLGLSCTLNPFMTNPVFA